MNPLRIDNKPGADTRHVVRHVLFFMADALEALANTGTLSEARALGASHVLSVCADALKETEKDEANPDGG
ncbi:hypothetical protein ACCAA_520028 [Candidatus Accumulibacter aalborgensis]|uniref:Uncharacterized protein n=1 Tax=Candidatus Accumulibacter aalborgensis TaxID=1860102 RepID=A0A1A8XSN5_9PROT|nr:hypothetical protein [Candidatus Accumulibacter aalborgensis]SBT08100.1 hypothetical protein ACCAA_520028 [Candidatus Accumulibacter aalborgensis]